MSEPPEDGGQSRGVVPNACSEMRPRMHYMCSTMRGNEEDIRIFYFYSRPSRKARPYRGRKRATATRPFILDLDAIDSASEALGLGARTRTSTSGCRRSGARTRKSTDGSLGSGARYRTPTTGPPGSPSRTVRSGARTRTATPGLRRSTSRRLSVGAFAAIPTPATPQVAPTVS